MNGIPTCYAGTSLGDQHSVPLLHGQLFFGPTAGSQRSPNAGSRYMHLKVDPQKVDHLVLI